MQIDKNLKYVEHFCHLRKNKTSMTLPVQSSQHRIKNNKFAAVKLNKLFIREVKLLPLIGSPEASRPPRNSMKKCLFVDLGRIRRTGVFVHYP